MTEPFETFVVAEHKRIKDAAARYCATLDRDARKEFRRLTEECENLLRNVVGHVETAGFVSHAEQLPVMRFFQKHAQGKTANVARTFMRYADQLQAKEFKLFRPVDVLLAEVMFVWACGWGACDAESLELKLGRAQALFDVHLAQVLQTKTPNKLVLSEGLAQLLAKTDWQDVPEDLFHTPLPAFTVHGFVMGTPAVLYVSDMSQQGTIVPVTTSDIPGEIFLVGRCDFNETGFVSFAFARNDGKIVRTSFATNFEDAEFANAATALCLNVILYLSACPEGCRDTKKEQIAALSRAIETGPKSTRVALKKRRHKLQQEGTTIYAGEGLETAKDTGVYATWVRGHWRQQPHGPRNSLRKLLWIRPFIRNDVGAGFATAHTYEL